MNLAALDEKLRQYCEDNQQSGVLRITVKDEILYDASFGYADREKQIPFDGNSMFTFYSLSKPFCALGFLRLKDQGLIDLDVHPSRYVPEMAGFDSRVTFRHMLHHISGLPSFGQIPEFKEKYGPGPKAAIREQLKLLSAYPNLFEPGTGNYYANINFSVQALAIENITGMDYGDYMRQHVFEPLGMVTAVVEDTELTLPNRVTGYQLVDNVPVPVKKSYDWMLGGGDIVGRVEDVYCLNKAVKQRFLVCEETWKEILTPSSMNKKGMGCTISNWHGKHRITHNGGHLGFRTLHVHLPKEDFDVIWLSNSGYGDARKAIMELIHDAFFGNDAECVEDLEMDKGYI